jgi:nicotinamide/nicotinate riboside kinase
MNDFYEEIMKQKNDLNRISYYGNDNRDLNGHLQVDLQLVESLKSIFKSQKIQKIILVDGFLIYNYDKKDSIYDLRIFMKSSISTLKSRRESRNQYNTKDGFWKDPENYFDLIVLPEYKKNNAKILDKNCQIIDELDYLILDSDTQSCLQNYHQIVNHLIKFQIVK